MSASIPQSALALPPVLRLLETERPILANLTEGSPGDRNPHCWCDAGIDRGVKDL